MQCAARSAAAVARAARARGRGSASCRPRRSRRRAAAARRAGRGPRRRRTRSRRSTRPPRAAARRRRRRRRARPRRRRSCSGAATALSLRSPAAAASRPPRRQPHPRSSRRRNTSSMLASVGTTWNLEPLQIVPTAIVGVLYLRRTRNLARRGMPVPASRQFLFWLGIGLVILALNSPIDEIGEKDFFFVHMSQHLLLGDLAPLCFVAGLTGPVLRPVLALKPVERLRFLTHPFVALADLGGQPLRLAPAGPLPGGPAPQRDPRARALPLLHLRRLDVVAGRRDAAGAGLVRHGLEARPTSSPSASSRPSSRTSSSGRRSRSTPGTSTRTRSGGSPRSTTRTSPGS